MKIYQFWSKSFVKINFCHGLSEKNRITDLEFHQLNIAMLIRRAARHATANHLVRGAAVRHSVGRLP